MTRRARALLLYTGVAYAATWLVWLPYLLAARRGGPPPNAFLFYAGAAGPALGALLAEWYERGPRGVAELLRRLVDPRRTGWWAAVGLLSPLALVPVAALVLRVAGHGWPTWNEVGITSRAPGLGAAATWLLMTASYGMGEELGWRGFLLPRLQAPRSALTATLLLSLIWGLWHLPAFWFRQGYVGMGPVGLMGFALGLVAGAIVLTALYNSARGSVLAVALWHGSWNWVATSDGLQGPWVAVMTALIMVAAPVLVWRLGARDLARRARPVVTAGV